MSKRLIWIGTLGLVAAGIAATLWLQRPRPAAVGFTQLVTRANGLLEAGDAAAAIDVYTEALRVSPESIDVRLNLANAALRADRPQDAARFAQGVLSLDPNNAAAHYLLGCALLRQNQPGPASEAFQQSWRIEPGIPTLDFQMGMAQQQLGHMAEAIGLFEQVVRAAPDHPSAHYQLAQLYRRAGRADDATRALAAHQQVLARSGNAVVTVADLERCKHTEPLAPFVLAQPDPQGLAVRFSDQTASVLGDLAPAYRGPLAAIDHARDGSPGLFARAVAGGFALLDHDGTAFGAVGRPVRTPNDEGYHAALTGDLDNDGYDDVVVLGDQDSRVFKFYEQGRIRDATRAVGLEGVQARSGLLADLDFTGNLDLITVPTDGSGLALHRNLGNFFFDSTWADSGLPRELPGATMAQIVDWNNEGLPAVFVARSDAAPSHFAKQRAAAYGAGRASVDWPRARIVEFGDLDNDLRAEAILATGTALEIIDREQTGRRSLPVGDFPVLHLQLLDYDNDGWLDIVAAGPAGLKAWRNGGHAGFRETTGELAFDDAGAIESLAAADFDRDGDTDLVTSSAAGLRFWRNDGGNQHRQLKLRLTGNRSNRSGLGVRVELVAGSWRTSRTVRNLPMEVGVGAHTSLDALKIQWFDLATSQLDVPVGSGVHTVAEPTLPSGSCPYLYVWDGRAFRFASDFLGAAPLGLPMNESMFVFADPEELLALGSDAQFAPRDDAYEVRITEELREVLYLDEAHLIAVDHPEGTAVHPTSKMVPGPPFPVHELWTLRPFGPPRRAVRSDGQDVTALLARADNTMVSPVQLRRPQVRGLAEPYSVTMDFDEIPAGRPVVLILTGWIRFGGGMANISGSLDPTLPFPFPVLEAERADGTWQSVDVTVGTPAGKTKTILVDLQDKVPAGTRRLRLTTAFEIYWDAAELGERVDVSASRRHAVRPARTDLRWRGYSRHASLPPDIPLTPLYDDVSPVPPWAHTPGGWFTRYGDVAELIASRDDRLALLAAGDELALSFATSALPPREPGMTRSFFLHVVGWDKDADFHVEQGWRLEPLPFHGMDDQAYGRQPRPDHLDDAWIQKFNTRWVSPIVPNPGSELRQVP